jgi:hypothetical protein
MISPLAPRIAPPAPHLAGYLRLSRRRYGMDGGPVEEPVWVKAADVQLVEARYGDAGKLVGSTVTLLGGTPVFALQSVDAVLALLSDVEASR